MIARTWRGVVRRQDADAYIGYLHETGVQAYRNGLGNRRVWMLRRDDRETTEFVMFTPLGLPRSSPVVRRPGLRDGCLLPGR